MIPLKDDNPTRTRPVVTIGLIVACVVVFIYEISLAPKAQQGLIYSLGFIPATVFGDSRLPPELQLVPAEATIISSMFLHGGGLHLAGNMLFLWIFGDNVEDAMGHLRFLFFYLICGTAAALGQGVPNPESVVPMIGASGAVSGVLGAYLLLYPKARVLIGIPFGFYLHLMRISAGAALGIWFGIQIISSLLAGQQEAGVAWYAHIAGFVAGVALIPLFRRRGIALLQGANRER